MAHRQREVAPTIEVSKNSRVRLRLINAANARIFGLNIPASAFWLRKTATGPVQETQDVILGPAQRADFIIDLAETTSQ